MVAVLKEVRSFFPNMDWEHICGSHGLAVKRRCYLKLLSQTLTNALVKRSDPVVTVSTDSTFGDFEGAGVLYCEIDVSTVSPIANNRELCQEHEILSLQSNEVLPEEHVLPDCFAFIPAISRSHIICY